MLTNYWTLDHLFIIIIDFAWFWKCIFG